MIGESGPPNQADPQERQLLASKLLEFAANAYDAGELELAIKLGRFAVTQHASPDTITKLGNYLAAGGQPHEIIHLYKRMLEEGRLSLDDPEVSLALGLAEAQCADFGEALYYFGNVIGYGRDTDHTWFYIASCYAHLRRFEAANEILARNIILPLENGRATSTAVLRLHPSRSEIPFVAESELPFKRIFRFDEQSAAIDERVRRANVIQLVCCDSRYFALFARPIVKSLVARANVDAAVHFHIANPNSADMRLLGELRDTFQIPIVITTESIDFGALETEQIRTYYSCMRYLILPELLAFYGRQLLVTDADQTILNPLGSFLEAAGQQDVGLIVFESARHNLLAMISASVCVANPTPQARAFFCGVRRYLFDRMRDPQALTWHLDQAALAVIYLVSDDVAFHHIPPQALESKTVRKQSRSEALFWSVTYSVDANAQKLNHPEYLQMLL